MIKYSIVILTLLSIFIFPEEEVSVEITGIWILQTVNGKANSGTGDIYMHFKKDGWLFRGSKSKTKRYELRWVLDRDNKSVILYSETESRRGKLTEVLIIEELKENTLVLTSGKDIIRLEKTNTVIPETGISDNMEEIAVTKNSITQKTDSSSVEAKPEGKQRMDISVADSTIIGKWEVFAMNMGLGIMGQIKTDENLGYLEIKKDGSLLLKIKKAVNNGNSAATYSEKSGQWVIDQNNSVIIFYNKVEDADAIGNVEINKLVELYEDKMTLQIPERFYIYFERSSTE